MKIKVLGCNGSQLPRCNTTSFLIGENVLVDAGAVTGVLDISEQRKIDYILVTHAHLDHIRDIMFLADNLCYLQRKKPLYVVGTEGVIDIIHRHLFNNVIWPDFSKIPNSRLPVIKFRVIRPGKKQTIGNLKIKAVYLNHTVETVGYIVEKEKKSVIFLGDTGPTDKIWQEAEKTAGLQAVFIETSLPDKLKDIADKTGHLTPFLLAAELAKLTKAKPKIYLYHIKPRYRKIVRKEIAAIKGRKINVLTDGQVIRL